MPPDSAGGKAPGAAAPGPPLGVEKESRTDARVRVRRRAVRVEVEKAGIAAAAPVAPDAEDTPARAVVGFCCWVAIACVSIAMQHLLGFL